MRKFNEVIEDVKAPNTQSLWLNEGELSYYGKNGWESIYNSDTKNAITDINNALSEEISIRQENDTILINAIKSAFNNGYLFAGVATTSTNPGTPDGKVFYIANGKGTYTNFGGLEVTDDDDFAIFTYDKAWAKSNVSLSSSGGIAQTVVETTYDELKSMRDNSTLTPGMWYRITDYKCATAAVGVMTVNNQFDVIVLATSVNTLSEQAKAINHIPQEGETDYFANNDLSAWQIWYCLDNDTKRFSWISRTGKGVIYRMIDEWGNDIPYDFKNIKFKCTISTSSYPYYYYTFASDNVENNTDNSLNRSSNCYNNIIKQGGINKILFIGNDCYNNTFGYSCYSNILKSGCYNNTFGNNCYSNIFGSGCYNNTFKNKCYENTLGDNCYSNILKNDCYHNIFGNKCTYNILGELSNFNNFGNDCLGNIFGFNNAGMRLGNNCVKNIFGNGCANIRFTLENNTLCDYYYYNYFGNGCRYIHFTNPEAASSTDIVQNYNFAQGIQGTSSSYLTINGDRNRAYETKVALNSSGTLKTYCEADLVQ